MNHSVCMYPLDIKPWHLGVHNVWGLQQLVLLSTRALALNLGLQAWRWCSFVDSCALTEHMSEAFWVTDYQSL